MNTLDVFLHAERAGSLERLPGAELRFTYDAAWLASADAPVSLSLPLREEAFEDRECRPFFAGLLPEGEFLKSVARAFHISAENAFTVLEEIGGECAGAISLVAPNSEPPFAVAAPPEWLSGDRLEHLLAKLPSRPLMIGPDDDEGVRLSLAGTRDKLPLLLDGDRIGVTRGRPPSTHIVKTPIPTVAGMVANEAYCMALAGEVGLEVAAATPIRAGEREALLVERYDRIRHGHEVRRIHQEDFCQAFGKPPGEKYESEGGPGMAACAALIRTHAAAPGPSLLRFLDAALFNVLIGNADAHSKNYSLLLDGPGAPRLAPLYDLLSTRVYDRRFGRKMVMKYGGEYRPDRIRGRHLDRIGVDLGIAGRRVRKHATDISERAVSAAERARLRLPAPWQEAAVIAGIVEVVEEFAETLRRAAAEPT
ncbi:MAG TPA: type II toxin-antitoxin system HipA family toxin [Solirubrobacterales bacterium]|jgi:serine/threonine-protein kinase HipA|nr:type II toxin-antitoxin system HipA family toxin [Solirubrobacterales bacterium]